MTGPDFGTTVTGVDRDGAVVQESVVQVGAWQVVGSRQAVRLAGRPLVEQSTAFGLGAEVGRQVLVRQQRFDVVGQEQPLGAAAALVVVHDAALEALIDEVGVGRVVGRT